MLNKTIFLDRDGVINKEVNYLHRIKDCEFIDGIFEACIYLQDIGFKIVIITNQSGIARGYFNENDYQILTDWITLQFNEKSIELLDIFHCPHGPDSNCSCRKPRPGMFLEAQKKYSIDMTNSWLIGDKEVDIVAANNAGITNTILVRSGHKINERISNAKHILNSISDCIKVIK
jgi:D-glycero-D-manno-heptose 1,7-bisphosphate phosphatase